MTDFLCENLSVFLLITTLLQNLTDRCINRLSVPRASLLELHLLVAREFLPPNHHQCCSSRYRDQGTRRVLGRESTRMACYVRMITMFSPNCHLFQSSRSSMPSMNRPQGQCAIRKGVRRTSIPEGSTYLKVLSNPHKSNRFSTNKSINR